MTFILGLERGAGGSQGRRAGGIPGKGNHKCKGVRGTGRKEEAVWREDSEGRRTWGEVTLH